MPPRAVADVVPVSVRTALAAARAAWPDFFVEDAAFVAYLRERVGDGEELAEAVGSLCVSDLYCACACAAGEPRALAAFERGFVEPAGRSLLHLDSDAEFIAEVKQRLRHRLLVSAPGQPRRIADYAGRGPLQSWVRAALLRLGLNLKRDQRRDRCTMAEPLHEASQILSDPELSFIKSEYRRQFKAALEASFAALERRERNLLRLHLLDGLNIDSIGVIYQVHRATVARWLAQARETLATRTRERLTTELGVAEGDCEQFFRAGFLPSQMDLSLTRLLRETDSEMSYSHVLFR